MRKVLLLLACGATAGVLTAATSVTQNGITWTFDKDYTTGQFINGDTWVIGPVKIIAITNDLNDKSFEVREGQNGSVINPSGGNKQGLDSTAPSYDPEMNVAWRDGKPISKDHPLMVNPGDSLLSAVSWLYRDQDNREPGAEKIQWTHTNCLRNSLRTAAVLTILAESAPEGTFRPGYAGTEKKLFNIKDVDTKLLRNLAPVGSPDVQGLISQTSRVWVDDWSNWEGAYIHPTENMPTYGRDMSRVWGDSLLALHLDWAQLPGTPDRQKLLINITQHAIDLTSMADSGTEWPPNGGHCMGRKPVILFAGILLGDAHMKDIGNWKNIFQDNQIHYVDEESVELSNSPSWKPDRRYPVAPYTKEMIGLPEWGINHGVSRASDNAHWGASYREVNNAVIPAFALAILMLDGRALWKNEAYFDYADRVMSEDRYNTGYHNVMTGFSRAMWNAYRKDFPTTYDHAKWEKFFLSERE